MMKLLARFPIVLVALLISHPVIANTLYQWQSEDGTPTFSPDPPPKGISYTVVGADLKPIRDGATTPQAAQPGSVAASPAAATPSTTAAHKPATQNGFSSPDSVVMTPAPEGSTQKPIKQKTPWKPVIYANDPNPVVKNQPIANSMVEPQSIEPAASSHCLKIKHQLRVLEGYFANAQTATEMDQAVLGLSEFKHDNKGQCGL